MPRSLRVLLLALLVACSAAPPRRVEEYSARSSSSATVIYVIKRKWHVDIGFAAADLRLPLASLRADLPGTQYLLFGFGDRHYLLDQDRGLGGALAALWPGPGLMLVTGVTTTLQVAFGKDNVIEIPVTTAQLGEAQAFVWRGLSAPSGAVAPLQTGPYAGSLYYSATQAYSAFHTCNTWAAEALQAAGLPVHSFGVELSAQLWIQARRLGHRQDADSNGENAPPSRVGPSPYP
jgi:uncharacterized protein (TIGR02117 family)